MGVDKWLYLDTGKFNGLIETSDESIKYPLYCEARGEPCEDFIIAGPTCDSQDVMYEYFRNPLPAYIKPGDRVYWLSTGAYTSSYCWWSSTAFRRCRSTSSNKFRSLAGFPAGDPVFFASRQRPGGMP
ncbi:MAG: hypothetical protein V8T86_06500 [Victivallis sp.]